MPEIILSSVENAWMNLAGHILLQAITDLRQEKEPFERDKARHWLLSPTAKYFFDVLFPEIDIDFKNWVLDDCPQWKINDREHIDT